MHEAAAAICGASVAGAMAVWEGRAEQAFVASGGLHHAMANRAAGFCIYNDTAVAIQALLDAGAERVAYIDIDVHHGDGTQWIFFEDPRVLTCSVHETGRYLFPGTGGIAERGVGAAEGTALNIPLPPYAGDRPYLRAIEDVILPAVAEFDPDVIVTQDGADPHHADPLAHLQVTMSAFPRAYRALHELARTAADGRWVALGGGGYTFQVVPARLDHAVRGDAGRRARRRDPRGVVERRRAHPRACRCRAACPRIRSPRSRWRRGSAPTSRATAWWTRCGPCSWGERERRRRRRDRHGRRRRVARTPRRDAGAACWRASTGASPPASAGR